MPPALRSALAAAALALAAGAAVAAPESEVDPVTALLVERGLLPAPDFVRNLRDSVRDSVRDTASDLVISAMNFLGVRYRRGGESADDGFDCSGFTRHVFERSLGLVLPRRADEQAQAAGLAKVKRDELKPGDLVFFNTLRRTFSHVGIYVGEGKFIHAPRTGTKVRIEDMRNAYWAKRFTGARRAAATDELAHASPGSAGSVDTPAPVETTATP